MQELQKHIPVTSSTFHKDKRREAVNTFFLSFGGQNAMILAEYLYKDATIYLQRKYNRFAVSCSNIWDYYGAKTVKTEMLIPC